MQRKLYTLSLHHSIAQLFNSIKLTTVFVLSHVFMKNKYCVLLIQYFFLLVLSLIWETIKTSSIHCEQKNFY